MYFTFEKIVVFITAPESAVIGLEFTDIVLFITAVGTIITGLATMWLVRSSKKQVVVLYKQFEASMRQAEIMGAQANSSMRQAEASFAQLAFLKQQSEDTLKQISSAQKIAWNHKVLSIASDLIACFEEFRMGINIGANYGKIIGKQKELQLLLNQPEIIKISERMRTVIDQKRGEWNEIYLELEKVFIHEITEAIR